MFGILFRDISTMLGALFIFASLLTGIVADMDVNAVAAASACSCSSGYIAVEADAEVAVDPSDNKLLNATSLRHQKTTFQVFGQLCQPIGKNLKPTLAVQLLLHGFTYSTQYWNTQWNGFQNYSYMEFSCFNGVSSFAYDEICSSRSLSPKTSVECQLPTSASIASSLARKLMDGTVASELTGSQVRFSKVFGIGHSLGSRALNYGAIIDGRASPFTGFIFTGHAHLPIPFVDNFITAAEADPSRWGSLDSGYVTTLDLAARSVFYGPSGTFDPTVQQLDGLTRDIASNWISMQAVAGNDDIPARYTGPVTFMIGELDSILCPCQQEAIQTTEMHFFPDAADIKTVIIPGQGHDLNLEFGAVEVFPLMLEIFKNATTRM